MPAYIGEHAEPPRLLIALIVLGFLFVIGTLVTSCVLLWQALA